MENKDQRDFRRFYDLAFAKRPAEELYALEQDPGQLVNLAGNRQFERVHQQLAAQLQKYLVQTRDPRALGQDAQLVGRSQARTDLRAGPRATPGSAPGRYDRLLPIRLRV